MPTLIDHVIQGSVVDGDKMDFAKEKFAVQAFIKGQEVAQADVDASGRYKLVFRSGEERPTTEIRVITPKAAESAGNFASSAIVMPTEFVTEGNQASVERNLSLQDFADIKALKQQKVLPIFGHVYAQMENWLEPQPGMKLDFYTVQSLLSSYNVGGNSRVTFTANKTLCCTCFTAPLTQSGGGGDYTGSVKYWLSLPFRPNPYFIVEISQFINGAWNQVYSKKITLAEVEKSNHFDFLIPGNDLVLKPVVTAPADRFRFETLGLIPCDDNHFIKGYVYSNAQDAIPNLARRPLRGVMRIFGLFATSLQVANYKFEIAATDENHLAGQNTTLKWEDLTDALVNHKWDRVARTWQPVVLGPDPITHVYRNIDCQPEGDWMEHALKLEWNSASRADGFYVLRIIALDQNNNPVKINNEPLVVEMPVLRIDNSKPIVKIEAVGAQECGKVVSTDGTLKFNITAHEPQGHLLSWYIRALAGRDAIELNAVPGALQFNPLAGSNTPGEGIPEATPETLTIVQLPPNLQACNSLVYNFELVAVSSAITGYPASEIEVRDDVNLMVAKS